MTTPAMHREFPTWYSRVDLDDDSERHAARWAGVSTLAEQVKYKECEDLLGVFMAKPGMVDGSAGDLMREAFTATDPKFPTSGNEAEMALLAEITLAIILDKSGYDPNAGYVANLIYSALHGGIIEVGSATDLLGRTKHTMRFQGNEARKRSFLPEAPKKYTPTIRINDCFDDSSNLADIESAKTVLRNIIGKAAKAMGDLAEQARKERGILERELHIQGEELELLWWASNGQSETTGKQFCSMTEKGKSLIAASEAANLTQFHPGPSSITGLLEKAGLKPQEKVSLTTAVNGCDIVWLRKIQRENMTPLTPIHFAISLRLPSPDSTTWLSHWSDVTGIDASSEYSEVEIAELFYQERLLLDAYGGD